MRLNEGPAVRANHVVFRYGKKVAVDSSSFEVPAGFVTALIGPNGSGKSTILNGIAGLIRPSSGSLQVFPEADTAPAISYVLQATKVNEGLPVTVREVVAMGRYPGKGLFGRFTSTDRAAVDAALGVMAITDLASMHLRELSAGQQQRVLVAQGLAQDHDLLLLDEPLTGLDMPSAETIDAIIHDERRRGRTVVVTTHDLAEARAADHVVLLAGRVVAWGPPEETLTREHLTEAYGPSLLHAEGVEVLIDDPAHRPVPGRHVHQDRVIHAEGPGADVHE